MDEKLLKSLLKTQQSATDEVAAYKELPEMMKSTAAYSAGIKKLIAESEKNLAVLEKLSGQKLQPTDKRIKHLKKAQKFSDRRVFAVMEEVLKEDARVHETMLKDIPKLKLCADSERRQAEQLHSLAMLAKKQKEIEKKLKKQS